VVSNHRSAAYRSGDGRDWRKLNGIAWRQANSVRRRLFERSWSQACSRSQKA